MGAPIVGMKCLTTEVWPTGPCMSSDCSLVVRWERSRESVNGSLRWIDEVF